MSQINVTTIRNRTGGPPSLDQGVVVGSAATFSSTVSIAGTLTYEDVTSIDSVGIITAQSYVSIADSIVHTGDINTSLRFPANDTFTVETAGSERIRVDSSGKIGINETSPGSYETDRNDLVIGNATGNRGLTISSASDGFGNIAFADTDSGVGRYVGNISYDHSNNQMDFQSNGSMRMRIDSSGNVWIGTSSNPGTGDDGTIINPNQGILITSNSAPVFRGYDLNTATSTSQIDSSGDATFTGNVISGSLSHDGGGGNYFSSGEVAAYSSTDTSMLWRGWDAVTGNSNTLTSSITAAGDATFAGSVKIGGTASANEMEEYEEGTYDAAITMGTSGTVTMNTSYDTLSYTKIGRLVFVTGNIRVTSVSSPVGGTRISLPFVVRDNISDARGGGTVAQYRGGRTPVFESLTYEMSTGDSYFQIKSSGRNYVVPAGSDEYSVSITYIT